MLEVACLVYFISNELFLVVMLVTLLLLRHIISYIVYLRDGFQVYDNDNIHVCKTINSYAHKKVAGH